MQRGSTEWVSFLHSPDEYLSNQRGLQDVEEVLGEDGFKLSSGWLRGMVGNDTRTDTWEGSHAMELFKNAVQVTFLGSQKAMKKPKLSRVYRGLYSRVIWGVYNEPLLLLKTSRHF